MSSRHERLPGATSSRAGSASLKAAATVFAAGVLAGVVAGLPLGSFEGLLGNLDAVVSVLQQDRKDTAATDGRASRDLQAVTEDAGSDSCRTQTWPYIDTKCADAAEGADRQTREVRVISTDRAAPTTLATRTPRVAPPAPAVPPPPAPAAETATEVAPAAAPDTTTGASAPALANAAPASAVPETEGAPETEGQAVLATLEPSAEPIENPPLPSARPDTATVQVRVVPAEEMKREAMKREASTAAAEGPPETAEAEPTPRPAAAEAKPEPKRDAEPAGTRTRTVTVTSGKRAKRTRTATTARTPGPRTEGLQRVPDPGDSLGGPTLVRTYNFPDGRRVTVYQRADSANASRGRRSQALAYGDEPSPRRRVFVVPAEDRGDAVVRSIH